MTNITLKPALAVITIFSLIMGQGKKPGKTRIKENELMDVWGPSFNENASFWIQQDSIYYPEHFKSYKYYTDKDSIFILFDGWTYKGTYSISNDSLFLKDKEKVAILVKTVDTSDLNLWVKSFDDYYKSIEKQLYDSALSIQKDNIDFSDITVGLENKYHQCQDAYEKTFLGFKLAQNYYTHFESSHNVEYRDKAIPLLISFINFKNGEPASHYLKLDKTKVHLIVNKWGSFSQKDQEDIMQYALLRGFGNGLPEILNKQ